MSKISQILLKSTSLIKSSNKTPPKRTFFRYSYKKKTPEYPFMITRCTPSDYDKILDLMWDDFYPDEPTTAALNLGRNRNCTFDDHTLNVLSKGYSIIARCKYDGNVVGASINNVACPWDPKLTENIACAIRCRNITKYLMFWAYIQKAPNLWSTFCTNQVFEIDSVFVDRTNRNKGLGTKLIEASRNLASDCGFRVVRVDATVEATARICESLKMRLVHEVPYCAYIGEDNKPVFDSAPPNESIKIFIDTPHLQKSK